MVSPKEKYKIEHSVPIPDTRRIQGEFDFDGLAIAELKDGELIGDCITIQATAETLQAAISKARNACYNYRTSKKGKGAQFQTRSDRTNYTVKVWRLR